MNKELTISDRPSSGSGTGRTGLQISQRGIGMPSSPIRKLAPLAYAAEDQGVKIYRLNIGQPDLPTPQKVLDA